MMEIVRFRCEGCRSPSQPLGGAVHSPDVEVLHVDVPVRGSLPLTPQQQTLLSRGLWRRGGEERRRERGIWEKGLGQNNTSYL